MKKLSGKKKKSRRTLRTARPGEKTWRKEKEESADAKNGKAWRKKLSGKKKKSRLMVRRARPGEKT